MWASSSDRTREELGGCECVTSFVGDRLTLDAADCPKSGRLADSPGCRASAVGALTERDATSIRTITGMETRCYSEGAVALLVAAGRFVSLAADHDAAIAARARTDPLGAARVAIGRGDPIARIAAETGLTLGAVRFSDYEELFRTRPPPPQPP